MGAKMDQMHQGDARPAMLAPGLLARKGEARPSLARGFEAAEYALAFPLLARGGAAAATRIAHHHPSEPGPRIARLARLADPAVAAPSEPMPAREKAAFTLRLDPVRHARLRDACASSHRSAQALVTQALDAFLADPRRIGAPLSVGG